MLCCCVLSYIGRSDRLYWAILVLYFGGLILFLTSHWFFYRRNASTRCNDNLISLCVYFSTLISKKIRARRGISKQLAVSVFFDSMLFPLPLDNSLACARNSAKWLVTDCVWYFRPGVSGILRIFPVPDRIRSSDDLYIDNNIHSHSWATSWFSWLVGLPADFHNHFLFLTSVVIDLPWPYFFSRIFQRDILDFLSPTDISCAHAGGLFHFRKGQGTYSIDPADYSSVMVMWLVPLPLTLAVMPLLPILVQPQQGQYPRRVCRRHQCLRMRTAQNWSFQMVKVAPAWATSECFETRRSFATHITIMRGQWTLQCICYHSNCHGLFAVPSFAVPVPELPDCRCMISCMISWSRIYDIVYDIIGLWYHKFFDIIHSLVWYHMHMIS